MLSVLLAAAKKLERSGAKGGGRQAVDIAVKALMLLTACYFYRLRGVWSGVCVCLACN